MRGDGTCADVSRSTAAFRAGRSCTVLFHHSFHGDGRVREACRAPYNRSGLEITVAVRCGKAQHSDPSRGNTHTTAAAPAASLSPFIFSA
jgi:hypothetical protein